MNSKKIEYLDFAKGLAILSIVIFHYSRPYLSGLWAQIIMFGGTGVHMFLFLSGFGLGLSSTKEPIAFYRKRFSKVLLPYYLIIILIFCLNFLVPLYQDKSLYALGGHLLLYKMFDENIMGSFGYHFWFVSTIVQFYLFFPLIIYWFNKTGLRLFILTSLLISILYWILISVLGLGDLRIYNSFFLQYLWEFNLGVSLASLYKNQGFEFWNQKKNILLLLAAVSLPLMGILAIQGGTVGRVFNDIPSSISHFCLSALLYFFLIDNFKIFESKISFIGSVSYELYLTHMFLFLLCNKIFRILTSYNPNLIFSLILVPFSVWVAFLFKKLNYSIFHKIAGT